MDRSFIEDFDYVVHNLLSGVLSYKDEMWWKMDCFANAPVLYFLKTLFFHYMRSKHHACLSEADDGINILNQFNPWFVSLLRPATMA